MKLTFVPITQLRAPCSLLFTFCSVLLALCAPAGANTRFGFGTIVKVDPDGKGTRMKAPHYVVHYEFRNLAWTRVWHNETYPFKGRTRHGWRVYFLDGKPSTAQEAIKVGRAICHTDNDMVMHVSTKPGPLVLGTIGSIDDGLARLRLRGACGAKAGKVNRGKVGEMRWVGCDIDLILDLNEKDIRGAAVVQAFHGASDHPIDCSNWKRNGNTLEGEFSIKVPFGKGARYKLQEGDSIEASYSFKATIDEKGVASGTYEGTLRGKDKKGAVTGETIARSAMPKAPRLWMQFDPFPGARKGYVILEFEDGKAKEGGRILFSKGHRIGEITAQELALTDGAIKGTLTGKLRQGEITFDIDAEVLANRWVSGNCTITLEGGVTRTTFRGGLCEADTVQLESATKEQKVEIKKMQAVFEPPKPAAAPAAKPAKKPKPVLPKLD